MKMAYTIKELAELAGISTRTLRFYEEKGLLNPLRTGTGEYRIYSEAEVDVLWQILFFKEMGFSLAQIEEAMKSENFDRIKAMEEQLQNLEAEKKRINCLIATVKKTIQKEKGEIEMSDKEKFEGLKKGLVEENEKKYGKEIRGKYGEETIDEGNRKIMNLSKEEYDKMQAMTEEILEKLKAAVTEGKDYKEEAGKEIAFLHKEWLGFFWSTYSVAAHHGVAQMYVADERFTAYYDKDQPGCAEFLKNAIEYHIK